MSQEITPYLDAPNPVKYAHSVKRSRNFLDFAYGLNVVGEENVPSAGAGLLAFSHRSYGDPWVLAASVPRAFGGWGKKQLKSYPFIGNYLGDRGVEFVDRENPGPEAYAAALKQLIYRHLFAVAIEGTHKNKGSEIGEAKKGAGRIALNAAAKGVDVPIIPVGMSTEKMHLHLGRSINVVFGTPIFVSAEENAGLSITERKEAAIALNQAVSEGVQSTLHQALLL